jgi:transcriptional regulator with XRE-family HTH domain
MLDDTGIKRELLAEYLGCNPSYLADMRKAHVPMSVPMRAKLSALLGIDEQSLFSDYLRENAAMKELKGRE